MELVDPLLNHIDADDLRLTPATIRTIHALRSPGPVDCHDVLDDELHLIIRALQSESITDAERALGSFTRRKLKTLDTWDLWNSAERTQLDQFHTLGMYGTPCKPPPGAIVLSPHWQYRIKTSGKRRSRNCCDGSPRAAPKLHAMAETYASCVEQPIGRLFLALSAALNYVIYGGDARDAFAHSPAPKIPTFIRIDDAFADWYQAKFGKPIDRRHVLPIQHALQGHLEAAQLWEEHITSILHDLGFRSTTHERNIYIAHLDGTPILLLRQVDDFALASPDPAIATTIFDAIGKKLQLPGETSPPFEQLGLMSSFNGLDVHQTRDYIKLSCTSYLRRLLAGHNWETPGEFESKIGSRPTEPIPASCIAALYTTPAGPCEHTQEHAKLEHDMGFAYRSLLGEILYAYVTARVDIGYAITTLAKFAAAPAKIHYQRLKGLALYLRLTIDWGIIYWRSAPRDDLPVVPLIFIDSVKD